MIEPYQMWAFENRPGASKSLKRRNKRRFFLLFCTCRIMRKRPVSVHDRYAHDIILLSSGMINTTLCTENGLNCVFDLRKSCLPIPSIREHVTP